MNHNHSGHGKLIFLHKILDERFFIYQTCVQINKFALPFTEGVLLTAGDSSGRRPELPAILDLCQYTQPSGQYDTEPKPSKTL